MHTLSLFVHPTKKRKKKTKITDRLMEATIPRPKINVVSMWFCKREIARHMDRIQTESEGKNINCKSSKVVQRSLSFLWMKKIIP